MASRWMTPEPAKDAAVGKSAQIPRLHEIGIAAEPPVTPTRVGGILATVAQATERPQRRIRCGVRVCQSLLQRVLIELRLCRERGTVRISARPWMP
jgi:hypothetical protein